MKDFPKKKKKTKLTQEEINTLASSKSMKKMEFIVKIFLSEKIPGPDGLTDKIFKPSPQ